MPLVINSLRGGHTQTDTNTHTYTDAHTETILRNQMCIGLWPACAWFKNIVIWEAIYKTHNNTNVINWGPTLVLVVLFLQC